MNQNERAAEVMRQIGGSFMRTIAEAWYLGDHYNRARLEREFAPEFKHYAEMAKKAQP